jgi:8-oxo-dGTP diphosphatase
VSTTIDAPQGAVRRALIRTDVWTRTARALGADAEVAGERAGSRAPLRTGDLARVRRRPARLPAGTLLPRRSLILRVTVDADRLPSFDVLAGPVPRCRITLTTASTGDQTLVTVTTPVRGVDAPLLRRRLLRVSQLLFGIVTLAAMEQLVVVAGAVIENGRVLAARRRSPPELAGKWELPGGKVDPGETDAGALARELAEELGVTVTVGGRVGGDVDLGDNTVLRCYRAEVVAGRPTPNEHDAVQWVDAGGLGAVDWLEPDRQVFPDLRPMLSGLRT